MKLGLQISSFTYPGQPKTIRDTLTQIAVTAEKTGFYSLWVMDHYFQIHYVGKPDEPMLEAYTTLGFLAGITKKVKLGTMVTGVIYRYPGLLIKAVTTLDSLSGGRAYLGIGAAWNEEESQALGFPFPPIKDRFERLEEALQIAHLMFTDAKEPFTGKHYQLGNTMNHPVPITKPHPPILIGGGGETKTLKFVAKYGDACNLFAAAGDEVLIHKLRVLKEHCLEVGRDYDDIEKTVLSNVSDKMNPDQIIEHCQHLKTLGFDHIIFSIPKMYDLEPIKAFDKIIPIVENI
jgi:F420-dependent oxidoreductase-like protein